MLDSVDFYSFKIIFFLIDIEIIVSLIPWLLIKKRPDLKANLYRPPKVRPKSLTNGGRYFYV